MLRYVQLIQYYTVTNIHLSNVRHIQKQFVNYIFMSQHKCFCFTFTGNLKMRERDPVFQIFQT